MRLGLFVAIDTWIFTSDLIFYICESKLALFSAGTKSTSREGSSSDQKREQGRLIRQGPPKKTEGN